MVEAMSTINGPSPALIGHAYLASGNVALVDPSGDVTTIIAAADWHNPGTHSEFPDGCGWLVQVPSGNPEPDSPADPWSEVPCGAPVFTIPGNSNGWRCANGHEHLGIEREWAIDGVAELAAYTLDRDLDGHEYAQIREMVTR